MQDLKNDRLFVAARGLIFQCMKKAMIQLPTAEELYALEKRARRERARYIAALFSSPIGSICERVHSALTAKVVRHV
jgi:hypothetical protein